MNIYLPLSDDQEAKVLVIVGARSIFTTMSPLIQYQFVCALFMENSIASVTIFGIPRGCWLRFRILGGGLGVTSARVIFDILRNRLMVPSALTLVVLVYADCILLKMLNAWMVA